MYVDSDHPYVHIFIAGPHLPDCLGMRLFGVRPYALNQVAMAEPGQYAFMMNSMDGLLYGPFRITTPVLYLQSPQIIWREDDNNRETFRFLIGLEAGARLYRARVRPFLKACRARDVRISNWDLAQRSAFTFLPADGAGVMASLRDAPWEIAPIPEEIDCPIHLKDCAPAYPDAWGTIMRNEKMTEMLAEFALMRDSAAWRGCGAGIPVFNQMRVGERASRCDILTQRGDTFYVIEMKAGRLNRSALREMTSYSIWARGNRSLLARSFAPGLKTPYVMGGILGSGNGIAHNPDALLLGYSFEGAVPRITKFN
jgi:hypothetical protein